ncbi:hypothetical protein MUP77_20160, partial [Candidatus Bathyarchaeota archaeon]|nr:hypothetical protein [Candidatus Bathyarchaeota archaeon]
MKRLSSVIMSSFLLFGLLVLIPSAQPLKTCRTEDAFPGGQEDTRLARNKTSDYDEKGILRTDITEHIITASELAKLKQEIGIWQEGKNYNQIVDGHGTGLCPPTEEEWREIGDMVKIVDEVRVLPTIAISASVDHTAEPWFPPIGNQYQQGSCTAWAVGYYMKTFQEAREHGWDL